MEENNFEKQVQHKMDELKFTPSDAVWDHVKMNIEKRKSRRWLLLIFLFAGIVLLSGLYYFSAKNYSSSNNKLSKNNTTIKATDSLAIDKNGDPKEEGVSKKENNPGDQSVSDNKISLPNISSGTELKKDAGFTRNSNTTVDIFDTKKDHQKIKIRRLKDHEDGRIITKLISPQPEVSTLNKTNESDTTTALGSPPEAITEESKIDNAGNTVNKNDITDTSFNQDITQQIQSKPDTSKTQKQFKNTPDKVSKKWNVGFLLTAGISHVGNQFLGLGYASADYLRNVTPATSQGGSISYPSKIKNAFGFIAGVFFEKAISPKTNFSLGINYKEFNTSNLVGQKSDSVLSFSSVNADKRYTNNFKFIELPLNLRVQLGNNKKFPVSWSGGITLSQMVKSNALQFDPYASSVDPFAKAYFTDNSFFNKTSIGVNTGFLTSLISSNKSTILAGPYFFYAASRLASEGLYNKKHLVFFGLQTQIIFSKK